MLVKTKNSKYYKSQNLGNQKSRTLTTWENQNSWNSKSEKSGNLHIWESQSGKNLMFKPYIEHDFLLISPLSNEQHIDHIACPMVKIPCRHKYDLHNTIASANMPWIWQSSLHLNTILFKQTWERNTKPHMDITWREGWCWGDGKSQNGKSVNRKSQQPELENRKEFQLNVSLQNESQQSET